MRFRRKKKTNADFASRAQNALCELSWVKDRVVRVKTYGGNASIWIGISGGMGLSFGASKSYFGSRQLVTMVEMVGVKKQA